MPQPNSSSVCISILRVVSFWVIFQGDLSFCCGVFSNQSVRTTFFLLLFRIFSLILLNLAKIKMNKVKSNLNFRLGFRFRGVLMCLLRGCAIFSQVSVQMSCVVLPLECRQGESSMCFTSGTCLTTFLDNDGVKPMLKSWLRAVKGHFSLLQLGKIIQAQMSLSNRNIHSIISQTSAQVSSFWFSEIEEGHSLSAGPDPTKKSSCNSRRML